MLVISALVTEVDATLAPAIERCGVEIEEEHVLGELLDDLQEI